MRTLLLPSFLLVSLPVPGAESHAPKLDLPLLIPLRLSRFLFGASLRLRCLQVILGTIAMLAFHGLRCRRLLHPNFLYSRMSTVAPYTLHAARCRCPDAILEKVIDLGHSHPCRLTVTHAWSALPSG